MRGILGAGIALLAALMGGAAGAAEPAGFPATYIINPYFDGYQSNGTHRAPVLTWKDRHSVLIAHAIENGAIVEYTAKIKLRVDTLTSPGVGVFYVGGLPPIDTTGYINGLQTGSVQLSGGLQTDMPAQLGLDANSGLKDPRGALWFVTASFTANSGNTDPTNCSWARVNNPNILQCWLSGPNPVDGKQHLLLYGEVHGFTSRTQFDAWVAANEAVNLVIPLNSPAAWVQAR
jgi:hypothetical protein